MLQWLERIALDRAARLAPREVAVWIDLAITHGRAGQPVAARDAAQRALRLQPDSADVLALVAETEIATGNRSAALASAERVLKLRPDFAPAYTLFGAACAAAGQLVEAEHAQGRLSEHGAHGDRRKPGEGRGQGRRCVRPRAFGVRVVPAPRHVRPVRAIDRGRCLHAGHEAATHEAVPPEVVTGTLGQDVAAKTRILYGGSVKADNILGFMREPNVDGALVGGASLDLTEFANIVRFQKHVGV